MADADATWDFGTAAQGTLLKRSFTFANTGALDLLTYVSAPAGLTVSQTGSRRVGLADMTTYEMALNTANLALGRTPATSSSAPATRTRGSGRCMWWARSRPRRRTHRLARCSDR